MAKYIINLESDAYVDRTAASSAITDTGATVEDSFNGFGYLFQIEATADQLAAIPNKKVVDSPDTSVNVAVQAYTTDHLNLLMDPDGGATSYTPVNEGGPRVYLVDTGVDTTHPELNAEYYDEFYTAFEGDYSDTVGHGTMMASLINGQNIGVAPVTGVSVCKIFNSASGSINISTIVNCLSAIMYNHKIDIGLTKVVLLPWNIDQNDLVDSLIAEMGEQNLVVIVAAGNDGADINTKSPGGVDNAITVGAHNAEFEVAGFTNCPFGADSTTFYNNYGAQLDIFAQGVGVPVAQLGGGYVTADGTSMSAAIAAAAATILIDQYPESNAKQIKSIMISEGSYDGARLLAFSNIEGIDYTQVNRSIVSVESATASQFAVRPSGDLATIQLGSTTTETIGIQAEATNVEVLDFAPLPPWATINLTTGVVSIDTSGLAASMAPGVYMFAVKGEMAGDVSVKEYSIKLYTTDETELDADDVSAYYYDADTAEYDEVVNYQVASFPKF